MDHVADNYVIALIGVFGLIEGVIVVFHALFEGVIDGYSQGLEGVLIDTVTQPSQRVHVVLACLLGFIVQKIPEREEQESKQAQKIRHKHRIR